MKITILKQDANKIDFLIERELGLYNNVVVTADFTTEEIEGLTEDEVKSLAYSRVKSIAVRVFSQIEPLEEDDNPVDFNLVQIPISMSVDFNNLSGIVFDQYGNAIPDAVIAFSIKGTTKASIVDGKLIEQAVSIEETYELIATYENLTNSIMKTIIATIKPFETAKAEKIIEINKKCVDIIQHTFKSSVKNGEQLYLLTEDVIQEINILYPQALSGKAVPFKNSTQQICEVWTAVEFLQFYNEASQYGTITKFYKDGLMEMIMSATTTEEIESIVWGMALPADIQAQIDSTIAQLSE